MRKSICFAVFAAALLLTGCASSDRMMRTSGGVLSEYSAPKSARIRSEKYQRVSRELSSSVRSNKVKVSGLDDTLINIWPFFFRSNAYWTVLWPFIDCDPYGFAVRPFYNHEGDEYSILFPLSAWNPVSKRGWVTLFAWTHNGFGFVPLTWQWKGDKEGGAYYTPLFIYNYDEHPLEYRVNTTKNGRWWEVPRWSRTDHFLFCCLALSKKKTAVKQGKWAWLYARDHAQMKNEWNYRFNGEKPFPASKAEFAKFRQEIFGTLPRAETRTAGFIPLWWHTVCDDGDFLVRFLLLFGMERNGRHFEWDLLGPVLARYQVTENPDDAAKPLKRDFLSPVLLSRYTVDRTAAESPEHKQLIALGGYRYGTPFGQRKPAIEDALKKLDPALKLPPTVVDDLTYGLFLDDLWKKYKSLLREERTGGTFPLFFYKFTPEFRRWIFPVLLTGWETGTRESSFNSLPLMTFISRTPQEDRSVVATPLVYYGKTTRRERRYYPVASRDKLSVPEILCAELNDSYALCGLLYRGSFGFNVAREGLDASRIEILRKHLLSLPGERSRLNSRKAEIDKQTSQTDRWKTKGEIERLKKLIRYEELKLEREKLAKSEAKYRAKVAEAAGIAASLGMKADAAVFGSAEASRKAADELIGKCTELRRYHDIGNGLFFRKESYHNGDYHWHLLGLLAGGQKSGDRESTHVLHLLYRHRREGKRSETLFFPFISTVRDGEDSRFSFLWRVFSLSRRSGKTGGHILFIPFGAE